MELSTASLISVTNDDFADWYDRNVHVAKAVAERLDHDLRGFARQSGAGRLAYYKVRIKEKQSFVDKITRLRDKPESLSEIQNRFGDATFRPQDIIRDLVGARMVFFFEPDRELAYVYFHTYPTFRVDEVELYEMLPEASSLLDDSVLSLLQLIRSGHDDIRLIPKESGYESMHLALRYNPAFLKIRHGYATSGTELEKFGEFPIELQIRTMLQDTWAQVEHTLSYADRKRPYSERNPAALAEDFRTQKMIAKACERYQNTIWRRYRRLQEARVQLTGASLELGDRLSVFHTEDAEKINRLNTRLEQSDPDAYGEVLEDVLHHFHALSNTYGFDFFKLEIPDEAEKWARQRVLILLLGYLMTFGLQETRFRIHTLLSRELSAHPADPRMTAVAIFEHVRFLDKWFRSPTAPGGVPVKRLFHDALVHYRAAGAYFGEYGYYRRAIDVMDDALDDYRSHGRLAPDDDLILNEAHLLRRLAEYRWAAFNLDGRTDEQDLIEAYELMGRAWASTDLPKELEASGRERRKILSGLLTIAFFRFIHGADGSYAGERLREETEALASAVAELLDSQKIAGKGHAMQALAVWLWRGNRKPEALEILSVAKEIIEQKARHQFYKGVVREIGAAMARM